MKDIYSWQSKHKQRTISRRLKLLSYVFWDNLNKEFMLEGIAFSLIVSNQKSNKIKIKYLQTIDAKSK